MSICNDISMYTPYYKKFQDNCGLITHTQKKYTDVLTNLIFSLHHSKFIQIRKYTHEALHLVEDRKYD
jgi:hypothetical protein